MKTSTLTTSDNKVANEWFSKYQAREPLEVTGQKYLIDEISTDYEPWFSKTTITMSPTTVTVKVLDLSNPPAGATHYHPRDEKNPFRKEANGIRFAWKGSTSKWVQIKNKWAQNSWERLPLQGPTIADLIGQGYLMNFPCTAKPVEPLQWDGKGLPPVGVDFEVLWSSTCKTYVTAKAVGHEDDGRVVYRITSGERAGEYQAERPHSYESDKVPNFRPIKTAEQLAAEQREAEITRFAEDITAGRSPLGSLEHSKVVATWLYDNDYRKVPK